jgi:hypothetical protein
MFTGLETAVETAFAIDVNTCTAAQLARGFRSLERFDAMAAAMRARMIAKVDADDLAAKNRCRDTTAWIAKHGATDRATAQRQVRIANALAEAPALAEATTNGTITTSHAHVITSALAGRPADTVADEAQMLVASAESMTLPSFAHGAGRWGKLNDRTGAHDPVKQPSWVHVNKTFTGRYALKGDLTADDGLRLKHYLDTSMDVVYRRERNKRSSPKNTPPPAFPPTPVRERTSSERCAEALVGLTESGFAADPEVPGGPQAAIGIVVTVEQDAAGTRATTNTGVEIDRAVLDEYCCDSQLYRLVRNQSNVIINEGRLKRTVTDKQRLSLASRDLGCAVPDCGIPPSWCHAHHIEFFRNGSTTDLDNLVLLCRRHHAQVHNNYWTIEKHPDKTFTFEPRDPNARSEPARRPVGAAV